MPTPDTDTPETAPVTDEQLAGAKQLVPFAALETEARKVVTEAKAILALDPEDSKTSELARRARLDGIRPILSALDKRHKQLKRGIIDEGKRIDDGRNALLELLEPLRDELLAIEQHEERKEAERVAALKRECEEQIRPYLRDGIDPATFSLHLLPEPERLAMIGDLKQSSEDRLAREAKEAAEAAAKAKLEAERLAQAEAEAAKLRAEAAEREAAIAAERAENERRLAKERAEADERAKVLQQKADAEKAALEAKAKADRELMQREAAEQAERERQERLKEQAAREVERQKDDAIAKQEREAREKAEAELAAQRQREADAAAAKLAAERAAAAAPDAANILAWIGVIMAAAQKSEPVMKTDAGGRVITELCAALSRFETWAGRKAKALTGDAGSEAALQQAREARP